MRRRIVNPIARKRRPLGAQGHMTSAQHFVLVWCVCHTIADGSQWPIWSAVAEGPGQWARRHRFESARSVAANFKWPCLSHGREESGRHGLRLSGALRARPKRGRRVRYRSPSAPAFHMANLTPLHFALFTADTTVASFGSTRYSATRFFCTENVTSTNRAPVASRASKSPSAG